tara:strand:- start:261 stop:476 length:216 start_codon:yes stop_codon:yes gene_type:complete
MTIKVTMTFLLDDENEPDLKDAGIGEWISKEAFYRDQCADDYMPDIINKAFRPYGYRYVDDIEYSYKQVKD